MYEISWSHKCFFFFIYLTIDIYLYYKICNVVCMHSSVYEHILNLADPLKKNVKHKSYQTTWDQYW